MWVLGLSLLKLLEADVLLGLCHLSSSSKSIVYHPQIFPSPFASAATPPSETQSFVSPSKKDIGDCTGLKWRLLGTLLALNPYLKPTCNAPLLCETGSKGSITGICLLN